MKAFKFHRLTDWDVKSSDNETKRSFNFLSEEDSLLFQDEPGVEDVYGK